MGILNGKQAIISDLPKHVALYPSDRPTYRVGFSVNPTAAMDVFAIEAGAGLAVRIQRIVITNPGMQTTAALDALVLNRTKAAGTGSTVIPAKLDPTDAAFSGVVRSGNTGANLGTVDSAINNYPLWVPAAVGAFVALPLETGEQAHGCKQLTIAPGTANGIALRHPGAAGASGFAGFVDFVEEPIVP